MYTLEELYADILRCRGPLTKKSTNDWGYREVWEAFNSYLSAIVDDRRTLSVQGLGKIGWRVENGTHVRLRPHFQLSDGFCRVYGVEAPAHPAVPEQHLATIEELNFSTAAIRYSQGLTKDMFATGLRALVQHLGEAVARGHHVSIDFDVAKLEALNRKIQFFFAPEFYVKEGLAVPEQKPAAARGKTVPSFAPPSQSSFGLRLNGRQQVAVDSQPAPPAALEPYDDSSLEDLTLRAPNRQVTFDEKDVMELGSRYAISDGSSLKDSTCWEVPSEKSQQPSMSDATARDKVKLAALDRHVGKMKANACEAVVDKLEWESQLKTRAAQERQASMERRDRNREHAEYLKVQMRQQDERRRRGRDFCEMQAACHDFPVFMESVGSLDKATDFVGEKKKELKHDLEQQRTLKQSKKQVDEDRERLLDASHIQNSHKELVQLEEKAAAKKMHERDLLQQAWALDKQLRSLNAAIEDHHRLPAHKQGLLMDFLSEGAEGFSPPQQGTKVSFVPTDLMSDMSGFSSSCHSSPGRAVAAAPGRTQAAFRPKRAESEAKESEVTKSSASPQQSSAFPSPRQTNLALSSYSSPRMMPPQETPRSLGGHARRTPIGAAGSLSLQRERLSATLAPARPGYC
eukprot:TRINITY_DN40827_c0_g1_i1.p1 TRINITY_DN40827_c0_g1~~TRINITY_DN40827_c0_g1_i1.p1  ORF type:complete len:629 (+),score=140.90 TRINITY_DN40827_c0_g1_i1:124-2010(+)